MFANTNILKEINDKLAVIDAAIDANGVSIATNVTNINTAWSGIASNASDIATNAAAIAAKGYVARGDVETTDFTQNDITADFTWRELDLSNIVPENAVGVLLFCVLLSPTVQAQFAFRKAGYSYTENASRHYVQVTNVNTGEHPIIPLNAERKIEYRASNHTWTSVTIAVAGWFV